MFKNCYNSSFSLTMMNGTKTLVHAEIPAILKLETLTPKPAPTTCSKACAMLCHDDEIVFFFLPFIQLFRTGHHHVHYRHTFNTTNHHRDAVVLQIKSISNIYCNPYCSQCYPAPHFKFHFRPTFVFPQFNKYRAPLPVAGNKLRIV